MRYEVLPRRYSLLIYADDNKGVNYDASCQINVNGSKGTIDTLNGNNFYKFLAIHGIKPFEDLGLDEVGAAVSKGHLKLLKKVLPDYVHVEEVGGIFGMNDAEVSFIRLTRKKNE